MLDWSHYEMTGVVHSPGGMVVADRHTKHGGSFSTMVFDIKIWSSL